MMVFKVTITEDMCVSGYEEPVPRARGYVFESHREMMDALLELASFEPDGVFGDRVTIGVEVA